MEPDCRSNRRDDERDSRRRAERTPRRSFAIVDRWVSIEISLVSKALTKLDLRLISISIEEEEADGS